MSRYARGLIPGGLVALVWLGGLTVALGFGSILWGSSVGNHRVRIDQVMTLGYKYLTPLALLCVLGAGLWETFLAPVLPWR